MKLKSYLFVLITLFILTDVLYAKKEPKTWAELEKEGTYTCTIPAGYTILRVVKDSTYDVYAKKGNSPAIYIFVCNPDGTPAWIRKVDVEK